MQKKSTWKRITSRLVRNQVIGALWRIIRNPEKVIFECKNNIYYYFPLDKPIKKIKPKINVKINRLSLKEFFFCKKRIHILLYRLFVNDIFIAKKGKEIIAKGSFFYKPSTREVALIDFETAPAYRRKGLYSSLIREMLIYLKKKGYSKVYMFTNIKNIPSIKGIKKMGFIRILK